jgi:hypothetical protein
MFLPAAADRRGIDEITVLERGFGEEIFGPGAQRAAEPGINGYGKAGFGPVPQRRRNVLGQQAAQRELAGVGCRCLKSSVRLTRWPQRPPDPLMVLFYLD